MEVSLSSSSPSDDCLLTKRRKDMFGDCALIEIIHLHDCLRGALNLLEADVNELATVVIDDTTKKNNSSSTVNSDTGTRNKASSVVDPIPQQQQQQQQQCQYQYQSRLADLERRVASRFKVIWSVFKSHSQAEDEFIWPALKLKSSQQQQQQQQQSGSSILVIESTPKNSPRYSNPGTATTNTTAATTTTAVVTTKSKHDINLEQEEYEEDHADEERMFSEMDKYLIKLREALVSNADALEKTQHTHQEQGVVVNEIAHFLRDHTRHLSQHLMAHLEKEETQCMPLVIKHLSKSEIHELVGQIMGKRSADTIAQIMTMAVQNLNDSDREEMVRYMKQSMAGTFFDKWLTMSGWNGSTNTEERQDNDKDDDDDKTPSLKATTGTNEELNTNGDDNGIPGFDEDINNGMKRSAVATLNEDYPQHDTKRLRSHNDDDISQITEPVWPLSSLLSSTKPTSGSSITSQGELEKLIRAIATNPSLTPAQKNTTIQGLRDSVWKSNQRQREMNMGPPIEVNVAVGATRPTFTQTITPSSTTTSVNSAGSTSMISTGTRRVTPPSMYFRKTNGKKIELVWSSDTNSNTIQGQHDVPLFSASELAPTYHDGAAGAVLGCPHYARACKLRHPSSGRLYTCRLCCEQQREMPMRDKDEPLDRYAVTEVMCMKCNALQPAEDRCFNPDCESRGKPFARYFCQICHLYDDGSRPIFHCPYCNACRLGLGLGIDFRHCMRCNACVSLADTDHRCIPQKLQGNCPICRETLFQSTEPLRGLKCGHVMHLSCFTEYRRGHAYTCPLCMRSMEDMKDYFALLDTAVRMQPMPAAYLSTMSNIYCQDCNETGRTRYHFVGQKCPTCGSYNTRELGRVHESPESSPR